MTDNWNEREIDLIVADYFEMLSNDINGVVYNKAKHNRNLQRLIERSRGSIEFKHQNISAVMLGLGQPWINGYKPAANFQNALIASILKWLDGHADWLSPDAQRASRPSDNVSEQPSLWIGPAPTQMNEPPLVDAKFMAAIGKKYDVAKRDEANRQLGKAGEELVMRHEVTTLKHAGRLDLAEKVRWTSVEDGDGYGFDISSFEPDGSDRLLEVKTTNGWERTPFHISRNELAVAEDRIDSWHLVRLWNFARKPQAFSLRPPLENHTELTATSFLATLL